MLLNTACCPYTSTACCRLLYAYERTTCCCLLLLSYLRSFSTKNKMLRNVKKHVACLRIVILATDSKNHKICQTDKKLTSRFVTTKRAFFDVVPGYDANSQLNIAYVRYDPQTTAGWRLIILPPLHASSPPRGEHPTSRRGALYNIIKFARRRVFATAPPRRARPSAGSPGSAIPGPRVGRARRARETRKMEPVPRGPPRGPALPRRARKVRVKPDPRTVGPRHLQQSNLAYWDMDSAVH